MTLILAIPTKQGVVFASDGQLTSGGVRSTGRKLYKLNEHCAWAAAGEVALIQRVKEAIGRFEEKPLAELRDELASAIKDCVCKLLRLDFRTEFFARSPEMLLSLHPGDFLFVEFRQESRLLHIAANGTPEWVERPYALGIGAPFAYALLQKYQGVDLSLDEGSLLAFKVIQEAIEVGAYGLGEPIDVWHLTSRGINIMGDEQIDSLNQAAKALRDGEIQLTQSTCRDTDLSGRLRVESSDEAGCSDVGQ